jgi:regulator of RNase E activity RraA
VTQTGPSHSGLIIGVERLHIGNGTICAHGYCHTPQVHVPVHVGGIVIYPNDLLHADRNGVTTIPIEIAAEMAKIRAQIARHG